MNIIIFFNKKIHLEIKDFNDEAITLKIGKATTATFKKSLLKSGEIGERPNVDIAFEPIGKFESPIDLGKTAPPLDILFRLWQSLFPVQSFSLSGFCEEDPARGLGLTLILKSSDNSVKTQTFWQQDYDPDMVTTQNKDIGAISKLLAKPAAIWTLFTMDEESAKKWLGFNNWQSYAYSIVGGDWARKNNIFNANKLLQKSLFHCAENRFALFNTGVLKIQTIEQTSTDLQTSRTILGLAKDLSQKDKISKIYLSIIFSQTKHFCYLNKCSQTKCDCCEQRSIYTDVIWYKTMYQLASLDEYESINNKGSSEFEVIRRTNVLLCIDFKQHLRIHILAKFQKSHNKFICQNKSAYLENIENLIFSINFIIKNEKYLSKYKNLKDFLLDFKPMCQIMYASMLMKSGSELDASRQITNIQNEYKIASLEGKNTMLDDQGNLDILSLLGAQENQSTSQEKHILPLRAYYNLACYHAARWEQKGEPEEVARTLRYLKYSVINDKSLAKWAEDDPSFKRMREKHNARFYKIIHSLH